MNQQKENKNIIERIPLILRLAVVLGLCMTYVVNVFDRVNVDSKTLEFTFAPLKGYWWLDGIIIIVLLRMVFLIVKAEFRLIVDYDDKDHDTGRAVNFLVFASIAITVAICGLLAADFAGHMADAEYKIKKEKFEKTAANAGLAAQAATPQQSSGSSAPDTANKLVTTVEKPPELSFLAEAGGFFGTFGDFFGGVLNPILTFGTLVALGITMLQQRKQLRDARAEAAEARKHAETQAFENVFFNMLSLHAQNVQDLVFDPAIVSAAISQRPNLLQKLAHLAIGIPTPTLAPVRGRAVFAEVLRSTASGAVAQIEMYRNIQQQHNDVLGHYFRHLYQILAHVDRFEIDGRKVDLDTRKRYSKILRAQLSSKELAVLLLNCTDRMVDKGAFQELVIRYQFLEHLPVTFPDGELLAPGLAPGNNELFFQYLDRDRGDPAQAIPGAFGTNENMARFLAQHQVPAWVTSRNPVD